MGILGWKLLLLFPPCSIVVGRVLRGSCPRVPDSMLGELSPATGDYGLVLSVPFQGLTSYLFGMPYGGRAMFLRKSHSEYLQEGFSGYISAFPPTVVCRVTRRGGELIVESTVYGKDAFEIYEKVRVWQEEGVVVIWSCSDGRNSTDHDAAVLILAEAKDFSRESKNATLGKVKRLVKSFIGDLLFESIQWDQLNLSYPPRPIPAMISTCLVGEKSFKRNWWMWLWAITPMVIWIILGRIFCGPGSADRTVTHAVVSISITPEVSR